MSDDGRVPVTAEIRLGYLYGVGTISSRPEYERRFDRWLSVVLAEAWSEGRASDEDINPYSGLASTR